jgi:hypothetical protein
MLDYLIPMFRSFKFISGFFRCVIPDITAVGAYYREEFGRRE